MLRTNSSLHNWITLKEFESSKNQPAIKFNNKKIDKSMKYKTDTTSFNTQSGYIIPPASNLFNKNLLSKLPTNATIIGNSGSGGVLTNPNSSLLNTSITTNSSDDEPKNKSDIESNDDNNSSKIIPRLVYHKGIESFHPTGHLRGFIKGILLNENPGNLPIFGVYCIKWRRTNSQIENESKFVISGIDIDEPPLNIYSSIEQ